MLGPDPEAQACLGPQVQLNNHSLFLIQNNGKTKKSNIILLGTKAGLRIARSIVALTSIVRSDTSPEITVR